MEKYDYSLEYYMNNEAGRKKMAEDMDAYGDARYRVHSLIPQSSSGGPITSYHVLFERKNELV